MLKMLLEDFRYRHENYWKLFVLFSGAILVLIVIPFIYQNNNPFLAQIGWVFPLLSILVAIPAAIILHAEYSRIESAGRVIRQIREALGYPVASLKGGYLASIPIGRLSNWMFFIFSFLAAALGFVIFHFFMQKP